MKANKLLKFIEECMKWIVRKLRILSRPFINLLKWLRDKKNEPLATWLTGILTIATVIIMFISLNSTLKMSKEQLEQSERLYELQNKPVVLIKYAGWYPLQVLSGDVGLRIRMTVSNYGKTPTNEAKVIKDIILRIKTDTLARFPHFLEDVNKINEQLDVNKEKRIVEEYIPYTQRPFTDISNYILEKRGNITKDDIIQRFSEVYKESGYEFVPYSDLVHKDFLIIPPGEIGEETGRSISVSGFENEILKYGGDILIFYYAIEYTGPLKIKKYITHYIGCYNSLEGQRYRDKEGKYLFTYQKSYIDEIDINSGDKIPGTRKFREIPEIPGTKFRGHVPFLK